MYCFNNHYGNRHSLRKFFFGGRDPQLRNTCIEADNGQFHKADQIDSLSRMIKALNNFSWFPEDQINVTARIFNKRLHIFGTKCRYSYGMIAELKLFWKKGECVPRIWVCLWMNTLIIIITTPPIWCTLLIL